MKKKSSKSRENMSPKELARYAIVSSTDLLLNAPRGEHAKTESDLAKYECSLYYEYIQKLDKDEYIEYLEHLVKETEYFWIKTSAEIIIRLTEDDPLYQNLDSPCVSKELKDRFDEIINHVKRTVDMYTKGEGAFDIDSKRMFLADGLTKRVWGNLDNL